MKTHVFTQIKQFRPLSIMLALFTLLTFNSTHGQAETFSKTLNISGLVSDVSGPLDSVNVIQKGTRNGTVTNAKGEFKFPVQLNVGDILIFSYLGYEKKEVEITNSSSFIEVTLKEVEITMIGALDSGKPYKSKRNKS